MYTCSQIHGRSRLQRYSRLANWDIVHNTAVAQYESWLNQFDKPGSVVYPIVPILGNGDIMSVHDWTQHQQLMNVRNTAKDYVLSSSEQDRQRLKEAVVEELSGKGLLCNTAMIGRGALIKPWLPKEIKDGAEYDIPASERMDIMQRFVNYGLEYWGSDSQGVETTRKFLLEWVSFLHRYVPAGICYRPQSMNQRPPVFSGRGDAETLLGSTDARDWIRISEMFLGPVPTGFHFEPKHKSNSYSAPITQAADGTVTAAASEGLDEGIIAQG